MSEHQKLQRAFDECRDVCRHRARNFYYGLKLSPEPQRSALYVIYAWMRLADDLVDAARESERSALAHRIEEFRAATDCALNQEPVNDEPLWLALAATAQRFQLPREPFHSMLAGQLDDLDRHEYRTFDDLRTYCHRVASSVGLLCIEIWGYEDAAARELAIERGIAFQMTNIVRDFREDFDEGRVYLPREDFERAGLTARDVREWRDPARSAHFLRGQIERARMHYQRSEPLLQMLKPVFRPTLWAMSAIYQGLLNKMERDPAQIVLGRRIRLSAWNKGMIAMRAKWASASRTKQPTIHTTRLSSSAPV